MGLLFLNQRPGIAVTRHFAYALVHAVIQFVELGSFVGGDGGFLLCQKFADFVEIGLGHRIDRIADTGGFQSGPDKAGLKHGLRGNLGDQRRALWTDQQEAHL